MNEEKVIFPKLSFRIVGCLFEVYKNLGSGHKEKYYQNALKQEFINRNIKYQDQVYIPLLYKQKLVGKQYFDFLVDSKIILELKVGQFFRKRDLEQILSYLKSSQLKLGILAIYTKEGVKFYRVLNNN